VNVNRFAPGTFSPDPRPATVKRMLTAQYGLELKLLLRNGEQLLLTMFIPITLLIGMTLLPFGSFGVNRAATFVPAIMALAVISTAFTGQAIAVAFDRRYGALKRLGATALPIWGIIAGKSLAVVTVVFLQSILLGAIGFALGWRPSIAGWFVFAGLGALTVGGSVVPAGLERVARFTPSGALAESLSRAMTLSVDWFGIAVLIVWGGLSAVAALRWFRFT